MISVIPVLTITVVSKYKVYRVEYLGTAAAEEGVWFRYKYFWMAYIPKDSEMKS